ncbi:hypothetical protein [Lyngbya sp. PCC 8106]|uniref:hypothetical protein n=1 Tax=Lyngbya sp. (strain PCC 8106) TaxID=313612 RepID=UPI0000EAA44C|nr:hypothetical protein [Lyngbya sp. PCC 8106]EAW34435.1 hypothetical protein L8106_20493 [Lyngbya sp. PCC 8106]
MQETRSIQEKLRNAWKNVNNIFLPNDSWFDDPDKCTKIQKKLSYFNPEHEDNPEHIDRVYKGLVRGINITQAAIEWEKPSIGRRNDTGKWRGIQWQLVIAYSGFEITTKALSNILEKKPNLSDFELMLDKCNLPNYLPLKPPQPENSKNLEKWLNKEEKSIAEFLNLKHKDIEVIEDWIVESCPINTWKDALLLARAFRNTTTHGFLVPSKVKDWKLKPSLEALTENIAEILVAALEKLES